MTGVSVAKHVIGLLADVNIKTLRNSKVTLRPCAI